MSEIRLEKISISHENEIFRIKKEYEESNDNYEGAFFIKDIDDFTQTIKELNNYSEGIMDNSNYVPYTCYVAINDENKIVGVASLRHELNDFLNKYGGHIGYSVVPSERRKGYGSSILKLLLGEAKRKNISKVLLTCFDSNIASKKIIEKNNGVLENKIKQNDDLICRYWIENK